MMDGMMILPFDQRLKLWRDSAERAAEHLEAILHRTNDPVITEHVVDALLILAMIDSEIAEDER